MNSGASELRSTLEVRILGCTNNLKLVEKNEIDMKYGCEGVNRLFTRPTVPTYHSASGYTLYVMTMWMTVYHGCILGLSYTPYFEVFRGVQMTSNSSKTDEIDMKYGCRGVNRPSKCLTVPSYHSASTILHSL